MPSAQLDHGATRDRSMHERVVEAFPASGPGTLGWFAGNDALWIALPPGTQYADPDDMAASG